MPNWNQKWEKNVPTTSILECAKRELEIQTSLQRSLLYCSLKVDQDERLHSGLESEKSSIKHILNVTFLPWIFP